MVDFPYHAPALRVEQPLGPFFVAILPAELLLQVATSDVMRATLNEGGGYTLEGTQRAIQDRRIRQIADYIDRADAAFPNAIILAANYNSQLGVDQDEVEDLDGSDLETHADNVAAELETSWQVELINGSYRLTIPTGAKLAAIIDGQHRLFSFTKADPERREMELLCAIYIDLPKALQAQLFATINSTQKAG